MKKRSDNIQMKISLGSSLLGGKTWSRHAFFAVLITFITGDVGSASKGHGENDWSVEIAWTITLTPKWVNWRDGIKQFVGASIDYRWRWCDEIKTRFLSTKENKSNESEIEIIFVQVKTAYQLRQCDEIKKRFLTEEDGTLNDTEIGIVFVWSKIDNQLRWCNMVEKQFLSKEDGGSNYSEIEIVFLWLKTSYHFRQCDVIEHWFLFIKYKIYQTSIEVM
jgi:hypothetical protein